jgi:phosphatidate cytidylyltransferase
MVSMLGWVDHLSLPAKITFGGIFALLVLSSVATVAMRLKSPGPTSKELRERVRTWWIIVAMLAIALCWSKTAAISLLAFVSFLALKEFFSMTPTRRADRRVLFWAYLAIPIQYYLAGSAWYGMFIIFIPVMMFIALPTRMWMIGVTEGFLRAASSLHWALMLTVYTLSHAAYLLVMQVSEEPRLMPINAEVDPGPGLLLFLLVLTEMNDLRLLVGQVSR